MDPSCLVFAVQAGGGVLEHFASLTTNNHLNTKSLSVGGQSVVAAHVHPIFSGLLPAGWRTIARRSNHLKLVSWAWHWVHCTQMTSTVTRSQSSRAPLGRREIRQISSSCVIPSCQHGPKPQMKVSNTLLNLSQRFKAALKTNGGLMYV